MLNFATTRTDAATPSDASAAPSAARRSLEDEVLREVGARNAGERIGILKRWHQGSLSLIHLYVLTVLQAEGSLSMGGLADALDVSVASATGIVDRMEKRGIVERQHVATDRRVVLVTPTDEGLRTIDEFEGAGRARLGGLIKDLTDQELAGLLLGVRALRAAGRRVEAVADDPNATAAGHAGAVDPPRSPEPTPTGAAR